jgi:predicted esterase
VRLWVDAAAATTQDGPIVLYWYGTGGNPEQAVQGLGVAGIQRITAAGGVVAAPVHVTTGGGVLPWLSGGPEDLALAEEIIGCAAQKVGIDRMRIHTLGFSAGALFSGRLSVERSALFASVATYSGGGGGTLQDPNNKYAAMLVHGGPGDQVIINFQTASQDFHALLTGAGHFAFICNHGGGHRIPGDAVPNVVQFFFDHPYGTVPSPYAGGFPPGFPAYCVL